jgi:hypothetical protein
MQVEIALPNSAGTLLPGAFVQVALPLAASRGLAIPNNALIIRGDGIKVAAIDAEGRVRLKPVQLGRNYGERVEVVGGVAGGERLVLNPSDSLAEGDAVSFNAAEDDKSGDKAGQKPAVAVADKGKTEGKAEAKTETGKTAP